MSEVTHLLVHRLTATSFDGCDDECQAEKSAEVSLLAGPLTHFRSLTDSVGDDLDKSRTFTEWLSDASTFDPEGESCYSMMSAASSADCRQEQQTFKVGVSVRVREDLMSDREEAMLLEKGQVGIVWMVDEEGDVGIDFGAHTGGQWVRKENLAKLEVIEEEEDFLTSLARLSGFVRT